MGVGIIRHEYYLAGLVVLLSICLVVSFDSSDADSGNHGTDSSDPFERPLPEYSNGYCFSLNGVGFDQVEFIEVNGLSYWTKTDVDGRHVAQLVSIGTVTEGQTVIVPESIINPVDGNEYQVTSVGICFQPFRVYDYPTGGYMYHAGLCTNHVDAPDTYDYIGYTHLAEPVHYSIVFKGCVKVQNYAFGEFDLYNGGIGEAYCFYTKSGITSVTFEKGVTSIGEWAFAYSSLGDISIPETVDSVGAYTFYRCEDLESVQWNTDADIPDHAFEDSVISGISINGNPGKIGEWAFSKTDLVSMDIPDSVAELGEHTFHFCEQLEAVSIGRGVEVIPTACFNSCVSLTEFSAVGTIKEVGRGAFYKGPILDSFDFAGLEIVEYNAFRGTFQGDAEIDLNLSKVKRIEDGAFAETTAPVNLRLSSELEYVGKSALSFDSPLANTEIIIPSGCMLDTYAFEALGVTKVSVGDNCTLKKGVFNNCIDLKTISFGQNCTLDDASGLNGPEGLFAGSGLESVTIPSNLVLGNCAFFGCEHLESAVFEGEREVIKRHCFSNCPNLSNVQLPDGLKIIERYAFGDCINLELSETPLDYSVEDVLSWSNLAFAGSASIDERRLFEGNLEGSISFLRLTLNVGGTPIECSFMTDIDGARNSMQLEEPYTFVYTMPDDLAGIYSDVMYKPMPQFSFPNNLYRTYDGAMYDESGFILVKVPYNQLTLNLADNVTSIAPDACANTSLTFVHISSSVEEIGDRAFQGCGRLTAVEFEEGLKRIGESAFSYTKLKEVVLPESLEYVGSYAFGATKAGVSFTIPCDSNLKEVGTMGLNVAEDGTIFIPSTLIEVGDIPFGYRLSEVYLNDDPSSYPSSIFRSSTMQQRQNGKLDWAHPFNVTFYIPLGIDVSGITFDQLLGCEDGCFGGYFVCTSQGPLLVDEKIDSSSGTVYFYSSLGQISVLNQNCEGDALSISLTIDGYWTEHDIICAIDRGNIELIASDSPYVIRLKVSGGFDDGVITIAERRASGSVTISFDSQGGSDCQNITVGEGRTITEQSYPLPTKNRSEFMGWCDGLGNPVMPYTPIVHDTVLYAMWADANPRLVFDDYAHFEVKVDGVAIKTGFRVSKDNVVNLQWAAREGYTFDHWVISTLQGSIEISVPDYSFCGVENDTEICLVEGYYNLSDTLRPINSIEFPTDYEAFYLQWMTTFVQNTDGAMWTGGTGTPLVVNGRLYTRAGDTLYMYDLDTGRPLKTVKSADTSAFYHYIGYANGFIFDYKTQKVYDLDLNYVCNSPLAAKVLSDDTGIYLGGSGKIMKYSLDMSEQIWSFSEGYCSYSSWGVNGGLQIYDGYLYWIGVKDSTIRLQSIDTESGKDFHELILSDFRDYFLDDGWVACYNNTLYITVYSEGLFGDNNGATGGGVIAVHIEDGEFSPDYRYYLLGSKAHSNFIVFNGRGYVNSGYEMCVFDVDPDDGRILEIAYRYDHSRYTHGGIVLNNPPGSDVAEIIFIPYSPTMSIMVFYDKPGQELPKFRNIYTQVPSQYNTQAVRFTDDGRIYFYNDVGNVCILGDRNDSLFLMIRENDKIRCVKYSGTIEDAISELNLSGMYQYMMGDFSGTNPLDFDESLAMNYLKFYFSDVPLTVSVTDTGVLWYSEEYGVMTIDGIRSGYLYLSGEEFLLADKAEYDYVVRFVDTSGNEIKAVISGKCPVGLELNASDYMGDKIEGYVYKSASAERIRISPDESRNVLTIIFDVIRPTVVDFTDDASEGGATLSVSDLQDLADEGGPVELILPNGKIELDNSIVKTLSDIGSPVSISLKKLDLMEMEENQREKIPDGAIVFDITLESGGVLIHELGGVTRITVPVPIAGDNLVLWHLDDSGALHKIDGAVFSDGFVSFTTDHLSYYVVGEQSEPIENEFPILYVVVGIAGILAVCIVLLIIRKKTS